MKLSFHNTLSGVREDFVPQDAKRITMYVCGPTVYSHPHIGNARPAVVFDLLYRLLRHQYGDAHVIYARNITDVDDKINAAAATAGVPIKKISERFTSVYHRDMESLSVLAPNVEPRATDHIASMIAMTKTLLARGHAYEAEGHVLFHVPSFAEYGKLSRRMREDMLDGARVEVAPYKKDATDFVLWKPSATDAPGWDSPWGRGRPGWHLECSCMAAQHLGTTIDIHGGGGDLVFPHHENELAQSTCTHHAPLSRFWMHNGFVNVHREKMAKSVGNVILVRDLLKQYSGEAVRLALLSTHYRKPLDWSDDTMAHAQRNLARLYRGLQGYVASEAGDAREADDVDDEVLKALADDLNTPRALARLFELAREARHFLDTPQGTQVQGRDAQPLKNTQQKLVASGALLGLLQQHVHLHKAHRVLPSDASIGDIVKALGYHDEMRASQIKQHMMAREVARNNKDYAASDRIRDELLQKFNLETEDRRDGVRYVLSNASQHKVAE